MPNGATHDRITLASIPAVMLGSEFFFGGPTPMSVVLGMALGSLFLSPDLDHDVGADPYKMWGKLRFVWNPYKKLVSHRSTISHFPVLGTALRLLYLLIVPAAVIGILIWRQIIPYDVAATFVTTYAPHVISFVIGLELASIVHIIADWAS